MPVISKNGWEDGDAENEDAVDVLLVVYRGDDGDMGVGGNHPLPVHGSGKRPADSGRGDAG